MNSRELIDSTPGLTYRKLDFWCHRGVFGAGKEHSYGSGYRRSWDDDEVRVARVLAKVSEVLGNWTGRRGGSIDIYRAVAEQIWDQRVIEAQVQLGAGIVLSVEVNEVPCA